MSTLKISNRIGFHSTLAPPKSSPVATGLQVPCKACDLDPSLLNSPATILMNAQLGWYCRMLRTKVRRVMFNTLLVSIINGFIKKYFFLDDLKNDLLCCTTRLSIHTSRFTMTARRELLSDIPDFSIFKGATQCTTNHKPGSTQQLELVGGFMVSTLRLNKSAQRGCPWCAIFWEAFKRSVGTSKPEDQDFIYWRYDGESFFEPWCTAQSALGKAEFKIQIYTDGMSAASLLL